MALSFKAVLAVDFIFSPPDVKLNYSILEKPSLGWEKPLAVKN